VFERPVLSSTAVSSFAHLHVKTLTFIQAAPAYTHLLDSSWLTQVQFYKINANRNTGYFLFQAQVRSEHLHIKYCKLAV